MGGLAVGGREFGVREFGGREVDVLEVTAVGDLVLLAEPGTAGSAVAARVLAVLRDSTAAAAVACAPVTDTLKLVDAEGIVRGTAERDAHRLLHPPAAFRAAHLPILAGRLEDVRSVEDVLTALVAAGGSVVAVDGGAVVDPVG